MESNIEDIEENLNKLKQLIDDTPARFIFNLDEVGHNDFSDAEEKRVIVPFDYEAWVAPYAVARKGKRSSCLVCISPYGIFGKPQIVVSRVTFDSNMYQYIPYDAFQIVHTKSGFVNSDSFLHYMQTIFLPNLRDLREKVQYYGKAVLIMDGYLSHQKVIESLNFEEDNLFIHFLVPHTSDQTQPLDISIFGVMKRFQVNFKSKNFLSYQTNQILKIHQTLYQACTPTNCMSAFRSIGIIPRIYKIDDKFYEIIEFDVTKCAKIRGYKISYIEELIARNAPLTPNQQLIYQQHINQNNPNFQQDQTIYRIPIESFATNNQNNAWKVA